MGGTATTATAPYKSGLSNMDDLVRRYANATGGSKARGSNTNNNVLVLDANCGTMDGANTNTNTPASTTKPLAAGSQPAFGDKATVECAVGGIASAGAIS
mmetsp:Transcript_25811/g.56604  ORF Transcript_25811/g.56604 Transcript_25811/m.56604 type:complete len:100 (-) Transcript_25811:229-528(-)